MSSRLSTFFNGTGLSDYDGHHTLSALAYTCEIQAPCADANRVSVTFKPTTFAKQIKLFRNQIRYRPPKCSREELYFTEPNCALSRPV